MVALGPPSATSHPYKPASTVRNDIAKPWPCTTMATVSHLALGYGSKVPLSKKRSRIGRKGTYIAYVGVVLCLCVWTSFSWGQTEPSQIPWAVRLKTRDQALMNHLAERYDIWTYRPKEGELLLGLYPDEFQVLQQNGLPIVVDWQRNQRQWLQSRAGNLRKQSYGIPGFSCYRTVEETYRDLALLAALHPELATWLDIGDSWIRQSGTGEGYDLNLLVLSNRTISGPKPPLLLVAASHAREYASAELATRFAEFLLANYGKNADVTWLLDYTEIHILPQHNPDGRKQAEAGLLWRKNANNDFCSASEQRGVDLNRNSRFFWGGLGASADQCSLVFRGPEASSEPETLALEDYMAQLFFDQRGLDLTMAPPETAEGIMISLHGFGKLVLYPWEGIGLAAPNEPPLRTLGRKFGFFTDYTVCQNCVPQAAGTFVDLAYGEYGVAAYTFELGDNFFESCERFENVVLPDNLAALLYAAKASRRPYQAPQGPELLAPALQPNIAVPGTILTLSAIADDARFASQGQGKEPFHQVASVHYTVDIPPWEGVGGTAMLAEDGVFDSAREVVGTQIDTTGWSAERHTIYISAVDSAGNIGVPSAVFIELGSGPQTDTNLRP